MKRILALSLVTFLGATVGVHAQNPITNGLVAYYPFSGNANDATGNGNNGSLAGVTAFGLDRFGNTNACLSLSGAAGTGSGVDIPTFSNLPYTPMTYVAWFRLNGYPPNPQAGGSVSGISVMTLVGREQCGSQAQGSLCLYSDSLITNQLVYFTGSSGDVEYLTPPLSQWCQVVLTINTNADTYWYLNGSNVPAYSGSSYNPGGGQSMPFRIGASSAGWCGWDRYTWDGRIDDVRVYNRVLSSAEVQQLYSADSPSTPPFIDPQPANETVVVGAPATLSFGLGGTLAVSYQWQFNNVDIPGATNSLLSIASAQTTNAGSYRVTVSNALGSATSLAANLTVLTMPSNLMQGLVAYYPFHGDANDATGNGNAGIVSGDTTLTADRFGNSGSAYAFDGVLGYIGVNNTILNVGSNYTITAWFMTSDTTKTRQTIFNTVPHTGIALSYNHDGAPGYLDCFIGPATGAWTVQAIHGSKTNYAPNQWYHVVFTKSGTSYKWYINGQVEMQTTVSQASAYNYNVGCQFGAVSINGTEVFKGGLDDFRIYNRAFTASEVQQLYAFEGPPCAPRRATATAEVVNGFVVGAAVTDSGCGYESAPVVLIQGGGGTGATATAVVSNGVVVNIVITSAGIGYTNTPDIFIYSPLGLRIGLMSAVQPCLAKAVPEVVNGFVVGATVTDGGCGYTNTPLVSIYGGGGSGATATAVVSNGVITNIMITDAGIGYTNAPTISIYPPWGTPIGPLGALQPSFSDLFPGTNYQLQVSGDLKMWTNFGSVFPATNTSMLYPQYWDLDLSSPLFFRLRVGP